MIPERAVLDGSQTIKHDNRTLDGSQTFKHGNRSALPLGLEHIRTTSFTKFRCPKPSSKMVLPGNGDTSFPSICAPAAYPRERHAADACVALTSESPDRESPCGTQTPLMDSSRRPYSQAPVGSTAPPSRRARPSSTCVFDKGVATAARGVRKEGCECDREQHGKSRWPWPTSLHTDAGARVGSLVCAKWPCRDQHLERSSTSSW